LSSGKPVRASIAALRAIGVLEVLDGSKLVAYRLTV